MKKKAFLREDGSKNMHLKIVISDPDSEDLVLVVSLCTLYADRPFETSCILEKGEHSWIRHQSYISYRYSIELSSYKILQERFKGSIIMKDDVSDEVLEKIQSGAKASKLIPRKYRKYFEFF